MLSSLNYVVTSLMCGKDFAATIRALRNATPDKFSVAAIDGQQTFIHTGSSSGINLNDPSQWVYQVDGKFYTAPGLAIFTPRQFKLLRAAFVTQYLRWIEDLQTKLKEIPS